MSPLFSGRRSKITPAVVPEDVPQPSSYANRATEGVGSQRTTPAAAPPRPAAAVVSVAPATVAPSAKPNTKPIQSISPPQKAPAEKGNRRPRNTVVVSLQMPVGLVKLLDDVVEANTYRNRSDLILYAVRSLPEVSRRLAGVPVKQPVQKK